MVEVIHPNTLILQYTQDKDDPTYGSCLWARFVFNLDRYEMTITSDCGNYGYKWFETPNSESFLHLMARCEAGYILNKIYGHANIFDYDETKKNLYQLYSYDQDDLDELNRIFDEIENDGWGMIPETAESFVNIFTEHNNDHFIDIWDFPQFIYPANALKICEIFEKHIVPAIKEILKEKGEDK